MAIATNAKLTIYRNLYDNTDPDPSFVMWIRSMRAIYHFIFLYYLIIEQTAASILWSLTPLFGLFAA